jgi:stress-induced morphogen
MEKIERDADEAVEQIAISSEKYEQVHRGAEGFAYRYNPAAIRVKIVDTRFHGLSKGERHDLAWQFLSCVSEDVLAQVSVLLCLAPGESALLHAEFDDPSRSYL